LFRLKEVKKSVLFILLPCLGLEFLLPRPCLASIIFASASPRPCLDISASCTSLQKVLPALIIFTSKHDGITYVNEQNLLTSDDAAAGALDALTSALWALTYSI
jgi:hypothetical protein